MKSKGEKTVLTAADYQQWIVELKTRYRATQIKAATKPTVKRLRSNWSLLMSGLDCASATCTIAASKVIALADKVNMMPFWADQHRFVGVA